jgi:hypothetical protein
MRRIMTNRLGAALAVCVALATGACGSDGATGDDDGDDTPGTPDGAPPPPPPGFADEVEPRIVGTYAMKMQVATIQTLPLLGMQPATQVSFGLAEITRDGDTFIIAEQGCRVVPMSGGGVTTTIDDAVPRSVPPVVQSLDVRPDGDDVVWTRPVVPVVLGAHLDDPLAEALPTAASDPRVWDQDDDGHPGVTAHVMGIASGDVYVAQRQKASYSGTLIADGQLTGLVTDASEQVVLDASNPVLKMNIPSVPDPDAQKSTVVLKRVDGAWDCDKLVAEMGALFP